VYAHQHLARIYTFPNKLCLWDNVGQIVGQAVPVPWDRDKKIITLLLLLFHCFVEFGRFVGQKAPLLDFPF